MSLRDEISTEPLAVPTLDAEFESLEDAIEAAAAALDGLEDRVSAALLPDFGPSAEDFAGRLRLSCSPVAERARILADAVRDLGSRIRRVSARVNL